MAQSQYDIVRLISQVTAQAQADAGYKARYLAEPDAVLSEAGLEIPPNVSFKVQVVTPEDENRQYQLTDDGKTVLVLPEVEEHVADESMAAAAAASCDSTSSTCSTICTCLTTVSSKSTNSCK
jgi:hypothetical protein